MNRFLYLAVRRTATSSAARRFTFLLQGKFLQNATLALIPQAYCADLDQLRQHFPSLGETISEMLIQASPGHVGEFFSMLEYCVPMLMAFLIQSPTSEQLQSYCDDLQHYIKTGSAAYRALDKLKMMELAALCKVQFDTRRLSDPVFIELEARIPPLYTREAYYIALAITIPLVQNVVSVIFQAYIPVCRANMNFRDFIDASRGYKRGILHERNLPWTYLGQLPDGISDTSDNLRPMGDRILLREFCKPAQNLPDDIACAVCMADMDTDTKDDEQPVITKCAHYFHQACLDSWVNDSAMNGASTCPSCRADMCQARARVPVSELEVTAQESEEESAEGNMIESIGTEATRLFGDVDRENSLFLRLRNRFRLELVPIVRRSRS